MLNFRFVTLLSFFLVGQAFTAPKGETLNIRIDATNGNRSITHLLSEISQTKPIILKHVPEATSMSAQLVPVRSYHELIITIKMRLTDDSLIKADLSAVSSGLILKGSANKPCQHEVKGDVLIPNDSEHFKAENVAGWGLEYLLESISATLIHSEIIDGIKEYLVRALVGDLLRYGCIEVDGDCKTVNGLIVTLQDHYGCTLVNYPSIPAPLPEAFREL